jgi:hypothetical protein
MREGQGKPSTKFLYKAVRVRTSLLSNTGALPHAFSPLMTRAFVPRARQPLRPPRPCHAPHRTFGEQHVAQDGPPDKAAAGGQARTEAPYRLFGAHGHRVQVCLIVRLLRVTRGGLHKHQHVCNAS